MKTKLINKIFNDFEKDFIFIEYHQDTDCILLSNLKRNMICEYYTKKVAKYCTKQKLNFYIATNPRQDDSLTFYIYKDE